MKRIMFRASLLIIASMISLPAWAGTFKDDFNDGNFDGWETRTLLGGPANEWKVDNGVLTCMRPNDWASMLIFGKKEWRNYSIECDVKMVKILVNDSFVGYELRTQNSLNDAVSATLSGKNAGLAVWSNWQAVASANKKGGFDHQLNRWYRLKGVANENKFEFYIDGELAASLSDLHYPTGRIAMYVYGLAAQFDNVVITGDDVPNNASALAPQGKLATVWGQMKNQ